MPSEIRVYEWTCPICGKSKLNRGERGEQGKFAIMALRTHIHSTEGSGHGPKGKLRAGESLNLEEHVERVDDDL